MKVVVVHRGARDDYQTARALHEAGMLDRLVTDLYWPGDAWEQSAAGRAIPAKLLTTFRKRMNSGLPASQTESCLSSGLVSLALEKASVPFSWKRSAIRWADSTMGRRAGELAAANRSALLSYSYYAYSAFRRCGDNVPRLLFQAHPHPVSVRRILRQELERHPECSESLLKEWELSLPEQDFNCLSAETSMADHWIAASSFTRQTLVENGAPAERVHVIPYGVRLDEFRPQPETRKRDLSAPLRLLFVGTINQRKGIRYLIDAVKLLGNRDVELRICGRVVDDLRLFDELGPRVRITPGVSRSELIEAYGSADLFVLPSVAEGFGQVLLEALACGLPVLSTTSTAAPDLIIEGKHGFIVPPCRSDLLAARIEWCLDNRRHLYEMRAQSRQRAEYFSWDRYRDSLASVVRKCLAGQSETASMVQHV